MFGWQRFLVRLVVSDRSVESDGSARLTGSSRNPMSPRWNEVTTRSCAGRNPFGILFNRAARPAPKRL